MARILLLHGLGGTGATMQPLADGLTAAGHLTHAPTLPGHGSQPEQLRDVGWVDWLTAAEAWPADVIVGQSMGGSLALALAARGTCRAVVAINPPAPDPDAVDGLQWRQSRGHEWVDGPPLADGEEGYTRLPIDALLQMAPGCLLTVSPPVTVPLPPVTSALDEVVDPFSADAVAAGVTGPVTRLRLERSGHVATLGPERHLLVAAIVRFVATPATP
ncbi:MAG: alpha/beta fold hydrolase [Ilumatobacteraceae bacterium]|nr:alpha/beta fold hydrolase [Ilumatobacteraceae bacterium]